jgi:NTE family protein
VATALDNRERIVLAKGSLPRAVRASLSTPVAFPPVDWHGRTLVDGGVVDNLPVLEARTFGAAVVVAVDVTSPPLEPERYQDILGVAAQLSGLLTDRSNADYHAEPDVLLKPDLGGHSAGDYVGFESLIAQGYAAAIAALPEIRRRLTEADAAGGGPRSAAPVGPALAGRPSVEIRVDGNHRVKEAAIRRVFNVPIGPPFDVGKALKALDKLQATGLFDHCWLDFEQAGPGLRIILRVREAPRVRAEVGGSYDHATGARGVVKLRKRNTFGFGEEAELALWASDAGSGARARLFGERLVTPALGFQVALQALSEKPQVFENGVDINRASFIRQDVSFRVTRSVKRWALLEAGLRIGSVKTSERLGLDFTPGTDAVRSVTAAFTIDNRDEPDLPTVGQLLALRLDQTLAGLGADRDYRRVTGRGQIAQRISARGVLEAGAFLALSSGTVPPYDLFRMGGPDLLPGRNIDELWGQEALAASLAFRLRTLGQLRVVGRVGAGQVFASRSAVRVGDLSTGFGLGLVYPTRVGPLRVDLGILGGGHTLLTFAVGTH